MLIQCADIVALIEKDDFAGAVGSIKKINYRICGFIKEPAVNYRRFFYKMLSAQGMLQKYF